MKNLALLFLFLFTFAKVDAIQTLIDGVYYDIYFYNETASVVKAQKYSGEMVIHPSVTYEGKSYPVTAINEKAFYECTGLTGITIPTSIQTIGHKAFEGCKALKSVTIPNSVTGIGTNAFKGCISLISVTLPNSLTTISASTFYNCNALTSVIIPNSVTSIGADAFYNCESLVSVNIPNSVKSIGDQAFWCCTSLTSITIPASVKTLGRNSFCCCYSLVTAVVSAEIIDHYAFQSCSSLTSVKLGDGVKEIRSDILLNCEKLDTIYLPDNIEKIYSKAFFKNYSYYDNFKVFVKNGTKSLLSLWTADYEPYDKETGQVLIPYVNSRKISSSSLSVNVKYNYPEYFNYSISFNYDYWFNSKTDEGASFAMQGLDPGKKYTYSITVKLKDGSLQYYKQYEISTFAMKLVTQQPKVISVGNVIVAAKTNVDETEENVGFEWRRTDWSDDFASNTGGAYIFEGTMEGYIRNLNAEKLWKYRCYYLSRNGNYYYGDWVGLDPSNTSYFEPTVHTYKDVETTPVFLQ